ncbi:putative ATPase [Thermodesulfitimonas autotrophica]|uniref:Replication-associated recombination protein A n=1 Tax=Thermodesulfitimonas autotrophica TaxID=1894989 RepID=A0A3N5ANN8_9THEO|nr:replication-associated recombination protein A [Thermodesulfitimonas autotrophica]RPF46806.1 putative ATPase [Thermodesulfitimonas autotrophica]
MLGDGNLKEELATQPLAARFRPRTLKEFVGQRHLLAEGKLLYRAIKAGRLGSAIFYGPPGTGKTALAEIAARTSGSPFVRLNAALTTVKELREVAARAQREGRPVVLCLDEIHHLNKLQQDALLPFVEDGIITLIGTTTENPYFEIVGALRSRAKIFRFEPLTAEDLRIILTRALADPERGLGMYAVRLLPEALDHLANAAAGDARAALGALEVAVLTTPPGPDGVITIDLPAAAECIRQRALQYDKAGDTHYDVASAFIKSIRGSDPDAALHYLARMVAAGEDVKFIARRLVISAAEDVGLADPRALLVAQAAADAVQFVGLPEARIILAEAVIYLSLAPKSNAAYRAVEQALADVAQKETGPVPPHLRDASYRGAKSFGHGAGYKYPHDYPGGFVAQDYLPAGLRGTIYYEPTDRGAEAVLRERLEKLRRLREGKKG